MSAGNSVGTGLAGYSPAMRLRALWLAILLSLAAAPTTGCDPRRSAPELLDLSDVGPRSIRTGDQLMVVGQDLPVGQVRDATVLFIGKIHRAGEPGEDVRTIEVPGAELTREGVKLTVDEALLARFCGTGEDARHATFSGRVEVWLPSTGRLPVYGSLKGDVAIDFLPRKASQRVLAERAEAVKETEEMLGARFVDTVDGEVAVMDVAPGGLLGRAGARERDVLTSVDDLTVFTRDDALVRADGKPAIFELARGDEEIHAVVSTDAFRGGDRNRARLGLVLLGALALAGLVLFGPLAGWVRWLATRLHEARDERAPGWGLRAAGGSTFAAPILFVSLAAAFAMFPIVELRLRTPLDLSLLYLLTLSARLAAATVTGAWGEGGFVRRRALGLFYTVLSELPATLALAGAFALSGGLVAKDLVELQSPVGPRFLETGGQPWHWLAFENPLLAGLFALFFLTTLVDRGATKSGSALGLLTWVHMFVVSGIGTMVFLGGYALPGVSPAELAASPWLQLAGAALFLGKAVAASVLALVLRRAVPTMEPRAFVVVARNLVLPIGLAAAAFTVGTEVYPPLPAALRTMTLVVLVAAIVVAVTFGAVVRAPRASKAAARVRVNPFL